MVSDIDRLNLPGSTDVSEIRDLPRDIPLACFRLASSLFAVDVMRILEIVVPGALPRPPSSSRFLVGDIVLRGNVIPVMDMRRRFRMATRLEGDPEELVVVRLRDTVLALGVDEVVEIITIPCDRIMEPPDLTGFGSECILGVCRVNDGVVMIVDIDVLLNSAQSFNDEADALP